MYLWILLVGAGYGRRLVLHAERGRACRSWGIQRLACNLDLFKRFSIFEVNKGSGLHTLKVAPEG